MSHKTVSSRTLAGRCRALVRDEDGGAYTLSYVMVIPILMLLVCVIVETTLMMSAKVGTVYAAYSGARTAVVWSSASQNWSAAEDRIEHAAIKSFVPFAGGSGTKSNGAEPAELSEYVRAYTAFAKNDPVSESYVKNKYRNASERLTVTTNGPPRSADGDIEVTVEYRFKFNIPGIGKLLGEQGEDGDYYFLLESTAKLQNEGPKNSRQELGIGYGKFE